MTAPSILAEGQVDAAKSTIYAVPSSTQAIIRTITFAHVAGGVQAVTLYVKKSGSVSRVFSRTELSSSDFSHEEAIGTLDAGDEIEAETTDAASVDFTVMGVQVTA